MQKHFLIIIFFALILITGYWLPVTHSVAFAQTVNTPAKTSGKITLTNPLCPEGNPECAEGSTVAGLVRKIVEWLRDIGGVIAVGFIIWGALQMVFAAGDPEKFKAGRQTIFYTIIGYAIILIGWGIAKIIENVLKG